MSHFFILFPKKNRFKSMQIFLIKLKIIYRHFSDTTELSRRYSSLSKFKIIVIYNLPCQSNLISSQTRITNFQRYTYFYLILCSDNLLCFSSAYLFIVIIFINIICNFTSTKLSFHLFILPTHEEKNVYILENKFWGFFSLLVQCHPAKSGN